METALLLGRDPVFAWALQKIMADLGLALEHVYTLSEAKIRLERFSYRLLLLDNLRDEEVEDFLRLVDSKDKLILFDAVLSDPPKDGLVLLSKDSPLPEIISSLKERLQQP